MFEITCGCCGKELLQAGALLFGCPRIADGSVSKFHLCGQCFVTVMDLIRAHPKNHKPKTSFEPCIDDCAACRNCNHDIMMHAKGMCPT